MLVDLDGPWKRGAVEVRHLPRTEQNRTEPFGAPKEEPLYIKLKKKLLYLTSNIDVHIPHTPTIFEFKLNVSRCI